MTLLRSLVLAVATLAVTACSESVLPETDPDLSGTLSEFLVGPSMLGAPRPVLVEREDPGAADRTIVHVRAEARVYLATRGQLVPSSVEDLAVGDRLQVWTTGVELRSYPGQVFATRVHIIR